MIEKLTKVVIDEEGTEYVACSLYGTETCQTIHNGEGCGGCAMWGEILNRLYSYENKVYEVT